MGYWEKRLIREQDAIAEKTQADIDKQLTKYYSDAMKRTIADFETTYEKVLNATAKGKEPTPADLYNLDRYWQMQAQLKRELEDLGDKEVALLSEKFEEEWINIYKSISLPSDDAFSTISTATAEEMIQTAWLDDGKNFSDRVWSNTAKLAETLNEQLVYCVVTGKKPSELKKLLQERFNVSYNQANTLVRTEIAHIQTQAAAKRYMDYGLEYYEFLGREEGPCGHKNDCHDLNGKRFPLKKMKPGENAPPIHPNCRCCIIPVVEDGLKETFETDIVGYEYTCTKCGHTYDTMFYGPNKGSATTCPKCGTYQAWPKSNNVIVKGTDGTEKKKSWDEYNKESQRQKERKIQDEMVDDRLRREAEAKAKKDAKERAAKKTDKGKTYDDAYTTKPLAKSIKEAQDQEGTFVYYTHQCKTCGRYFNSTVRQKKKCPCCGSDMGGETDVWWGAMEHKISNKRCTLCGTMFDATKTPYSICDDCKDTILGSKEAKNLKRKGHNDESILGELAGQESRTAKKRDGWDKYFEYVESHPTEKEYINENVSYLDYDKHFLICIDCGDVFFVEGKNNTQKRCNACQEIYRKKYKAEKEKERRARNKNK